MKKTYLLLLIPLLAGCALSRDTTTDDAAEGYNVVMDIATSTDTTDTTMTTDDDTTLDEVAAISGATDAADSARATEPTNDSKDQTSVGEPDQPADDIQPAVLSYFGTVLAGTTTPLIEFNAADFAAAQRSGMKILLYFYANWCPICAEELPKMYSAFDQADNPEVIGFRVNFNDSDTDADEKALANDYGVPYQHYKIILQNGEIISRSPEAWTTDAYLRELQ